MMTPIRRVARRTIDWLRNTDLVILLAVLVLVGGVLGFLKIADAVGAGATQKADERILRALRNPSDLSDPIGPSWVDEAGRDLTALGGVVVLFLVTAAVLGFLLLARKYHAVLLLLVATLGGLLISSLLKNYYERPRPAVVPYLSYVYSSSFPSGHSMLSAVVYLTLGSLLAHLAERRRLKIYCVAVAMLLTFLVGASRVYLGVHYPTDVLAGWAAGLAWAVLCWLVTQYLQRRGAVEKPG
jgi:undecaprenyl-diphosphatase